MTLLYITPIISLILILYKSFCMTHILSYWQFIDSCTNEKLHMRLRKEEL